MIIAAAPNEQFTALLFDMSMDLIFSARVPNSCINFSTHSILPDSFIAEDIFRIMLSKV